MSNVAPAAAIAENVSPKSRRRHVERSHRGRSFYLNADIINDRRLMTLPPKAFKAYIESICYCSEWRDKSWAKGRFVSTAVTKSWGDVRIRRHLIPDFWEPGLNERGWEGFYVKGEGTYFRFDPVPSEARREWGKLRLRLTRLVFQRDGRVCSRCGATTKLSIHHKHPLSRGGSHNLANLQVLCQSCNSRKGARLENT